MKRISEKMIKWSAKQKLYILKLVLNLKKKVVEATTKGNSNILMRLEMTGMVRDEQKCLIFIGVLHERA